MASPKLKINPPLLNSSSPWATSEADLRTLLLNPSTGGITTRTSLISGFDHSPERHRYTFFSPTINELTGETYSVPDTKDTGTSAVPAGAISSLNNLGYSPHPLEEYLNIISTSLSTLPEHTHSKTIVISITGPPSEIASAYSLITSLIPKVPFPLAIEINLSCPNIPNLPPPAYDSKALEAYLSVLPDNPAVPIGIKTPPYTHAGQFQDLINALKTAAGKISFITATNTLGSCFLLGSGGEGNGVLPGTGLGGMAGTALHPLALGNVKTLRKLLDEDPNLAQIDIIGVGGVSDGPGYKRMRSVGASAVALATALGTIGPQVFNKIQKDIDSKW